MVLKQMQEHSIFTFLDETCCRIKMPFYLYINVCTL